MDNYSVAQKVLNLKKIQPELALVQRGAKDAALEKVAETIKSAKYKILEANDLDVNCAIEAKQEDAFVARLRLDSEKIDDITNKIVQVVRLEDPVGRVKREWITPDNLKIKQVTVPLGTISVIYESRPNVTVDAFSLAYKAGCPILLWSSSVGARTNNVLVDSIKVGLSEHGIPGAVELEIFSATTEVNSILCKIDGIDAVLPRGRKALIDRVVNNANVPAIETGEGNCHIYIEPSVCESEEDMKKTLEIIDNAKSQKPEVCNAMETLLVHRDVVHVLMPHLAQLFKGKVELRCDKTSYNAINPIPQGLEVKSATEKDWSTEFLANILAIKTVNSIDDAINHINTYGTKHSEAIITKDIESKKHFCNRVDAACVYTNASTRLTDSGVFGFGAELGISTQKLHIRGPMGLEALTTTKYHIEGSYHIRGRDTAKTESGGMQGMKINENANNPGDYIIMAPLDGKYDNSGLYIW